MYNLRLLDINRKRIAIIDHLVSWRYNRRPSEATEISVTLPREAVEAALPEGVDPYVFLAPHQVISVPGAAEQITHEPKHERAQVAHYVEIYRGTQHVVTGRISKRDIKDDVISIQCHTEEIELERHVTPAQYGRKWDHWDLADVARDMLRGWHVQRVKDKTQWDAAIERVNVDTSTEPGVVMLAKSGGKYVSQGHITLRFSKADVPGFHSWDRIRWASDNAAPVRTTMQWRADGGSWSEEIEGALPDEIGVVPGTATADVIDVRINLYTEDTEAQDAEGNPVGVTPYVFAVEVIARTQGRLQAGNIPESTGVLVSGLEADGASALNVLSQACAQAGWEFWVKDGKLNIAEKMGQDRTSSVLLRAGTNMTVQTLSEGDDELVNVLTAYGPGEGINRLQVTRRHEESIAKYGEYRGVQTFEGATTLAALIDAADAYLADHAAPVPAFQVEAHYPYGEEPEFGCGDYVRVADPRNGIITRSRIAEEVRSYSTSGLKTTLYLGMPAPSLARQVRPTVPPRPVQPPDKPVISVTPIPGGIRVIDTKAPSIRWSTSEVHVSTTKGFTPSAETLVADGRRVRFDVGGLTPDMRYYVRLIRFDTDGNASEPSDEMSVVAGKFPQEELPADLFQIKATSDVEPDSGTLENLWDQDTTTGAAWTSGPVTVTFEYPMQWFFDMVRLYATSTLTYYVEARTKEGTWVQVTGNQQTQANSWTVQRFASNKMFVTDALRITFPGSAQVDLRELKFWTITLADEILAQKLRLTGDMEIINEDGSVKLDALGLKVDMIDGHKIGLGKDGLAMTPQGFQQPGMKLTGYMQGFWDKNNVPSIGLGDVREMASQLGSEMEYGILIAQGEIRASQSVLEASLVDRSITGPKIEDGTISGVKIAPGGVTLLQLNEFLQIPDTGRLLVQRYRNTTATSWVDISGSTWRQLASWSVSKRDTTNGYLMEVCRVEVTLRTRRGYLFSGFSPTEARLLLDGSVVATFPGPVVDSEDSSELTLTATIVLDFRSLSEGSHTFAVQMRTSASGVRDVSARIDARTIYQNEQLPVRWGRPIYTIEGGVTGGCFTGCQVMCESGCQVSCQSNCEAHCQIGCQVSCQSTCQTTSQGGGGCLREGTPVTIWDPDLQVYREVPVEQLRPGMILPGYDPETDTLEHGELVELVDAKFSNRFLRIHTDVGPSVDVTYSQPFDVLVNVGGEWQWRRMKSRFLQPGMKLVRPFEQGDARFATITQVEQVLGNKVHFWNPKVSNGRYLAAGYADWVTK